MAKGTQVPCEAGAFSVELAKGSPAAPLYLACVCTSFDVSAGLLQAHTDTFDTCSVQRTRLRTVGSNAEKTRIGFTAHTPAARVASQSSGA